MTRERHALLEIGTLVANEADGDDLMGKIRAVCYREGALPPASAPEPACLWLCDGGCEHCEGRDG